MSWYQLIPHTSLQLIESSGLGISSAIIDVGGGESLLADHLLELGYTDISVLDISATAIEKAKKRLGRNADKIKWIVSDITEFKPERLYDFWHDRAAFHFLTSPEDIEKYLVIADRTMKENGQLLMGTFSEEGPEKCSGISIKRYSENSLTETFEPAFTKTACMVTDHITPSNALQSFIFCSFIKSTTGIL